ncbi:hypothetical protein HMPREF9145_2570 [Segatella salivae F0493]|uniref:Uncharacterized protein n=1 Tax=Segatella salivae F0493 TaxID=1395125 RepID=U2L0W5_9BACT|nr:hypothetical protein HMPREF9145_2570 [Segatella salivae F0493]
MIKTNVLLNKSIRCDSYSNHKLLATTCRLSFAKIIKK